LTLLSPLIGFRFHCFVAYLSRCTALLDITDALQVPFYYYIVIITYLLAYMKRAGVMPMMHWKRRCIY